MKKGKRDETTKVRKHQSLGIGIQITLVFPDSRTITHFVS